MNDRTELTKDGRRKWTRPLATPIPGCQLGDFRRCGGSCGGCGWNIGEAARRKNLIRRYGLVTRPDGMQCLVIRREG